LLHTNSENASSPSSQNQNTNNKEIKGKLIVVEGVDGLGKSTQIRLVGK